jgi:hypothetical protein
MKIIRVETLLAVGEYAQSEEWRRTRTTLHQAIRDVDWPAGSGMFTIYPERGKKRSEGNGVTPIKNGFMRYLESQGWRREEPLDIATHLRPGDLDAVLHTRYGPLAIEWETGNVSSSHRALNKMALGLLKGLLAGGLLIIPTRAFARYLTDRIGNIEELLPYFDFWRAVPCSTGVLEVVAIEHDATSIDVPRIRKGTSGRARE